MVSGVSGSDFPQQTNPLTVPMTDPWCCYIWCSMDPINIPPLCYHIYHTVFHDAGIPID